jgi:hypothetical protein
MVVRSSLVVSLKLVASRLESFQKFDSSKNMGTIYGGFKLV